MNIDHAEVARVAQQTGRKPSDVLKEMMMQRFMAGSADDPDLVEPGSYGSGWVRRCRCPTCGHVLTEEERRTVSDGIDYAYAPTGNDPDWIHQGATFACPAALPRVAEPRPTQTY
eukprot:tig00000093_g3622.t1